MSGDDHATKLRTLGDVQREMARVYRAMRDGRLGIAEGTDRARDLHRFAKLIAARTNRPAQ